MVRVTKIFLQCFFFGFYTSGGVSWLHGCGRGARNSKLYIFWKKGTETIEETPQWTFKETHLVMIIEISMSEPLTCDVTGKLSV